VLLACLCILSIVFTAFLVLRVRFPAIPPMEPTQEHREFIARRFPDQN
jgi:hypothetical protein